LSVQCGSCGVELPMRPGPYTTCPRCVPEPDVAGRIAAELVEAALARSDHATARELLTTAEAWRRVARVRRDDN
jgi:hypothetical protein